MNVIICSISNPLSNAIVDDVEGTMKTTDMSIVDFSNIAHIEKVINNSGDSAAGHGLQRELQLAQDSSPTVLFDLSRAEIFEN